MTNNINVPDEVVREIIEKDIFVLLKAEGLPEEEKGILRQNMIEEISMRLFLRIDDMLTDDEKLEFLEVFQSDDETRIGNYFRQKGISIDKISAEVALQYKAELVAYVQNMNQVAVIGAAIEENTKLSA